MLLVAVVIHLCTGVAGHLKKAAFNCRPVCDLIQSFGAGVSAMNIKSAAVDAGECIKLNSEAGSLVRLLGYVLGVATLVIAWLVIQKESVSILWLLLLACFFAFCIKLVSAQSYIAFYRDKVVYHQMLLFNELHFEAELNYFSLLLIDSCMPASAVRHTRRYFFLWLVSDKPELWGSKSFKDFYVHCNRLSPEDDLPVGYVDLSMYFNSVSAHRIMAHAKKISALTGLEISIAEKDRVDFQ